MARIREKGLKPFECEYLDKNSILVNYGTVICPATNSKDNIFIPKGSNGKYLDKILDGDFIGPLPLNNIVNINEEEKGCICLKIIFKDIDQYIKESADEWEKALFQRDTESCIKYLKETLSKKQLKSISSDPDLGNLDLADSSLGFDNIALLTTMDLVDPASPNYEEFIEKEKEAYVQEKNRYPDWIPESSGFSTPVNIDDPFGYSSDYIVNPLDWLEDVHLMPLINSSPPILEVLLEFHSFNQDKEAEERLDKYNFIINSSKLVPIAYLDMTQKIVLEQIIDFDYIFSFPFYFNANLSTKFI